MGRLKKLGTETCPKCHNQGRIHEKNIRSRATGRYVARSYFLHNDRSIEEHYIDNFERQKRLRIFEIHPIGKWIELCHQISEEFWSLLHTYYKISERVKTLPLNDDETKDWDLAQQWFSKNVLEPRINVVYTFNVRLQATLLNKPVPEQIEQSWQAWMKDCHELAQNSEKMKVWAEKTFHNNSAGLLKEAKKILLDITMANPYLRENKYIYEKYDRPKRLERNKKRNKKLSEWNGRKTTDYTGIENSNPNLLPS